MPGYVIVFSLKVEPLFCAWIKDHIPDWDRCVVVSPDEGGVKRSVSVANDLNLDFALIHNRNKPASSGAAAGSKAKKKKKHSSGVPATEEEAAEQEAQGTMVPKPIRKNHPLIISGIDCRHNEKTGKISCLSGSVEGRSVILIDDMVDTGRTIKHAAEVLAREGACELYVLGNR